MKNTAAVAAPAWGGAAIGIRVGNFSGLGQPLATLQEATSEQRHRAVPLVISFEGNISACATVSMAILSQAAEEQDHVSVCL